MSVGNGASGAGPIGAVPVVGLSTYREPARWGAWQAPADLLPASYSDLVRRAGGAPVLLLPGPGAAAAVGRLDALVLTGGGDLDPARYGAQPHPATSRVSPRRDASELELLAAALGAGLPVLGICRGLQVLNVARGGTLVQDLAAGAGHAGAPGTFGTHPVTVAPGSRLGAIVGAGGRKGCVLQAPTAHHQAVGRLGDGLVACAWAGDGVIEAVELAPGAAGGSQFVVAVQWHPEAGDDDRLMRALVAAASGART
jgi:putative glutamine amidotransferase